MGSLVTVIDGYLFFFKSAYEVIVRPLRGRALGGVRIHYALILSRHRQLSVDSYTQSTSNS